MKSLFILSTKPYAGKNLVAVGIGLNLKEKGFKVGYFKPLGVFSTKVGEVLTDTDVLFFKEAISLKDPLEEFCPVVLDEALLEEVYKNKARGLDEKVRAAFKKISHNKDLILVMGIGSIYCGSFLGLSEKDIIHKLGSHAVLVDRPEPNDFESLDGCMRCKEELGNNLIGVVFNKVSPDLLGLVNGKIVPFLKKKQIETLGVIPQDTILNAVTVGELKDALMGRLICCGDKECDLVERFLIGAMNVESAIKYFRRVPNKAVITGGDRSDIQLAALETSTRCLILTGGLYPDDIIISKAEEKGVPILVVPTDTLTTVDRFEALPGHRTLRDKNKIKRAKELIEKRLNLSKIMERLRLKR
ncbi:MAG: hypothetical protein AMJ78_07000 [Omnitrophica WOR_2 bacterium SM23_29]|nr:MAG: hypothetical protein AMJ78_07000 [Omnitrophica WOR_2 bacterium SM23_29]